MVTLTFDTVSTGLVIVGLVLLAIGSIMRRRRRRDGLVDRRRRERRRLASLGEVDAHRERYR